MLEFEAVWIEVIAVLSVIAMVVKIHILAQTALGFVAVTVDGAAVGCAVRSVDALPIVVSFAMFDSCNRTLAILDLHT